MPSQYQGHTETPPAPESIVTCASPRRSIRTCASAASSADTNISSAARCSVRSPARGPASAPFGQRIGHRPFSGSLSTVPAAHSGSDRSRTKAPTSRTRGFAALLSAFSPSVSASSACLPSPQSRIPPPVMSIQIQSILSGADLSPRPSACWASMSEPIARHATRAAVAGASKPSSTRATEHRTRILPARKSASLRATSFLPLDAATASASIPAARKAAAINPA